MCYCGLIQYSLLHLSPDRYRSPAYHVQAWYDEEKDYTYPYPHECNPWCPERCSGPMCTHYTQVSEKKQFAYSLRIIISVGLNKKTLFMVLKLACEGVHEQASISPHQQSLIGCMCGLH